MFGSSKELIESARSTISGEMFVTVPMVDLASRTDVAKEVSASSYEAATSWGQEVTTFFRFFYREVCIAGFSTVPPLCYCYCRLAGSTDRWQRTS